MNAEEQKNNNQIKHIAVILDGNRRFAKAQGKESWKGHDAGAETFEKFLGWAEELGIKEITAYILSIENLKRDGDELIYLFNLFKRWFKKFSNDKRIHEKKIKISFIGELSLVPENVREMAEKLSEMTKNYDNLKLNFCFAYGGRLEIMQAIKKLLKEGKQNITEKEVTNALWLKSEPELIIRTGNAMRTSNFLPWQSVYSEWIFLEKMWPEFTKDDLVACLKEFDVRKRNFGK